MRRLIIRKCISIFFFSLKLFIISFSNKGAIIDSMHPMEIKIIISIVVASYNSEKHIEKCIQSVTRQYTNSIEVIIVDGNSTDNTKKIITQYIPQYNIVFFSEPDKGQSEAFNKGVKLAKGDWILWLNSDDELCEGVIANYLKEVKKNKDYNFFYGDIDFIDENGKALKTLFSLPLKEKLIYNFLYTPPTSGSLFNKKLLIDCPLDENFIYSMDSKWFIENFKILKPKLLNLKTTKFRVDGSSKTSNAILYGKRNERQLYEKNFLHKLCEDKYGMRKEISALYKTYYYFLKLKRFLNYKNKISNV